MVIEKGKNIGILGGGQLGKMLCESASKKGYNTIILDPGKDACASKASNSHIIGEYNDKESILKITKKSDVITYEFENVTSESVDIIKNNGGYIPQGIEPLYVSQNRLREKRKINELGIKTAKFKAVDKNNSLDEAIDVIGYPSILKTSTGGYDGKGQWIIKNEQDKKIVNEKLKEIFKEREYILEKMISFECELSCFVVRSTDDSLSVFPVAENIHKKGILHLTIVPARISNETEERIKIISKEIIKGLNFVGPLAIEYFYGNDGEIYVNEIAPRPHNSFHYTMDACDCSQFDMHIDAICGKKLKTPKLLKKVVMLNILGQDVENIEKCSFKDEEKLHMYNKGEAKLNRKMGHLNILGNDIDEILERINEIY
ncbi:MAG: 5-(carboxyamino)imidazole ribonucleotide synthase [Fusobacterium sp. JB021]|nr:5-(carboxyamino)imidazole ribonucleotide synthase [Fusobacterium sp. JB021]MDP0507362.1 5-(carboxyamino)imidazole ribonucleotide synthase [Fusobacterium sp. JB019]